MCNRIFVFLLAALTFLGNPEFAAAESAEVGRVVEIEIPAPSLAGNLVGTTDVQAAAIYLPAGYDDEAERHYPVIYLLHGIFDDYGVWLNNEEVPARLDRLIAAGAMPAALVVMPNAGNRYGGGYYRNSPITGKWEDYIVDDLIGHVDANFRTVADSESRAVVGHSMGGYGAIHLVIHRPGVFSVAWAMSPCCLSATDDFGFGNDAWKRAASVQSGEDIENLLANRDFFAIATLGIMSAFGAEAGDAPIYAVFPFEIVRGEVVLDEQRYDQHLDSLPLARVSGARNSLRELRGLGLGVGLGDQFIHIPKATIAFAQRLGEERIPHVLDVYDGDHRQLVGERLESFIFPWVGSRLKPAD